MIPPGTTDANPTDIRHFFAYRTPKCRCGQSLTFQKYQKRYGFMILRYTSAVRRLAVVFGILLLCFATLGSETRTKPKEFTAAQKKWWSLQPVVKPSVPSVANRAWVRSEIDAFVLAKLEEKKIAPNKSADRTTLLRRATLDLTGLPPTLEETQAFLADTSPQAFEKVVDRLLASPRYGERWARHWLDVARYADSEGFKSDETRPNVWRYRDYVIRAFNDDKPYDRFVKEQIAGDELYPGDADALVATGFNRHFPDESNAANISQRRQELLNDITDVTGYAFMGLTVACARCHDHKFDPILQRDYYRLQAFFANTNIDDDANLASAKQKSQYDEKFARWDAATHETREQMQAILKPARDSFYQERLSRFPQEIQDVIGMAHEKRNPYQWQMAIKAMPQVTFTDDQIEARLKGDAKSRYQALERELAKHNGIKPAELPIAQAMVDHGAVSPKTFVLSQGAYDAPMDEVQPGFPTILDATDAKVVPMAGSTGRRAALAHWLASPKNPLTARVMVNRVWHYHFGKGIAGSPSDFGVMGERPANRELLDYLAAGFVQDGWSVKKLHKRIMMSSVYQESSAFNGANAQIDPNNKLMWRFNRRRLEGEAIRDSILATAGMLNTKMYGPGVFPPLPPGMVSRGGWKKQEDAADASRRSVYIFVRRNTRYPMIEAFDMADTHESCARRNNTVTPMQALELLNNELVTEWSKGFARRVKNDSGLTPEAQVDRAWRIAYLRPASDDEKKSALQFLQKQQAAGSGAPFADLCHALLNSNEFLYIN